MYFSKAGKQDLSYITKGIQIKDGESPEIMYVGNVLYN